jgi:hypothetical protein
MGGRLTGCKGARIANPARRQDSFPYPGRQIGSTSLENKTGETMSICTARFLTMLLAGGSGAAFAAGPDFKEGEWGVSYRIEVVGMPFPGPPITARKTMCLDKNNYVPDNSQQGQECTVSDQKVNGNTVTWTMRCRAQKRTIEGQGTITYKGERYDGVMGAKLISADSQAPAVGYQYTMQGQRLGACGK